MTLVTFSALFLFVAMAGTLGSAKPQSAIGSVWRLLSSVYPEGPVSRIIGGEETPMGGFPFQVSVQIQLHDTLYAHICGGSIVEADKIATAAHCRLPNAKYRVVAGILDFENPEKTVQYRQVCSFTTHPNFNFNARDFDYDYAVIRLCTPLQFNSAVNAVKLTSSEPSSGICHIAGWGVIQTSDGTIAFTARLHNVSIPLVARPDCTEEYAQIGLNITERMTCSGEAGKGICFGDDGSGLICKDELVGIALFGGYQCDKAPSLFANVAEGRMWLDSQ